VNTNSNSSSWFKSNPAFLLLGFLVLSLSLLFGRGWLPGQLVFSNDGPLGQQNAAYHQPLQAFTGSWADLNWLGTSGGNLSPGISATLNLVLGPVWFSKLFAPTALLFVGLAAWYFFRRLGFTQSACVLGGLAAAFNGDFVATACWGVAGHPICFGLCYLAMGLVADLSDRPFPRLGLAGLAVGACVVEGADIGAIFSVFVACWIVVHSLLEPGTVIRKALNSGLRAVVVAGCAALMAASILNALIGTQIKGVVGMAQDEQTKAMRWSEATQWSLPKREIIDVFVPGFFGFRMDTPRDLPTGMQKSHTGGAYWGFGGRDASWDAYLETDKKGPVPGGFFRYGMGAGYAGILVLLGAAWAVVQSFRRQKSFFTLTQRKMIWFWLGVMVVCAAFMFGRFAPFYKFLYALPYASTFRNPAKFLHVFEWALIVIFAYGMHGLTTLYLERATATTRGVVEHFQFWWKQTAGFDKKWVIGTFGALLLGVVAWGCYTGWRSKAEAYVAELNQLAMIQQSGKADPIAAAESATATINFSLRQVRWAVGALAVSVGLLALLVSGAFAGKRARTGAILLGVILVVDLGWQARPWVIAQNWEARYLDAANNPVFDFLREKPYTHRVSNIPGENLRAFRLDPRLMGLENMFQSVYGSEWTQHLFPYYNIQTINIVQMPRRPLEYDVFEESLRFYYNTNTLHHITRRWELSSTRYIACAAPLVNVLNQGFDADKQRFVPRMRFDFQANPKDDNYPLINTNAEGRFAIVEFTGALPKAKLYNDWQSVTPDVARIKSWIDSIRQLFPPNWPLSLDALSTNDLATLELLTRASFDPAQQVLLAEPVTTAPSTNATPGTVEYVSYHPKNIVLKTKSAAAGVLLLNDRYDPNWQVTVDGKSAKLLRCNYLMRGVAVPAGEHQVEFHFRPDTKYLYVSLAAIALGICLVGCLLIPRRATKSATK
jgi:hypothetical protein